MGFEIFFWGAFVWERNSNDFWRSLPWCVGRDETFEAYETGDLFFRIEVV